ncbi:hypothetical protein L573_1458, partial [Bordetella holmesii H620]
MGGDAQCCAQSQLIAGAATRIGHSSRGHSESSAVRVRGARAPCPGCRRGARYRASLAR